MFSLSSFLSSSSRSGGGGGGEPGKTLTVTFSPLRPVPGYVRLAEIVTSTCLP